MKKFKKSFIYLSIMLVSLFALTACGDNENKENQAPLVITEVTGKTVNDGSFQLATTGGSGTGAVTFTQTSGTDVATVNAQGLVTIIKAGDFKVKATKAADENYNAITSAELTISIANAPLTFATVMTNFKNADSFSYQYSEYMWSEEESKEVLAYSDIVKLAGKTYSTFRVGEDEEDTFYTTIKDGVYYDIYRYYEDLQIYWNQYEGDTPVEEYFEANADRLRQTAFFFDETLYVGNGNVYTLKKDSATANKLVDYSENLNPDDVISGDFVITITIEAAKITIVLSQSYEGVLSYKSVYEITNINSTTITLPPFVLKP